MRIETSRHISPASYTDVRLDVYNRFDHTDLAETKAIVKYRNEEMLIDMPHAAPHSRSTLRIPAKDWQSGDSLTVEITDAGGLMIDRYVFTIGADHQPAVRPGAVASPLHVADSAGCIVVENSSIRVPFSKVTGLITAATVNGDTIIEQGPYLNADINYNHLTGAEVRNAADHLVVDHADWTKKSVTARLLPSGNAAVEIVGYYKQVDVRYQIVITPDGEMAIDYETQGLPDGYLRETGLAFILPENYERLRWERQGYWDNYPADAMSGNTGDAAIYDTLSHRYGCRPPHSDWASDVKNFYYWADRGTNAAKPLTMRAKAMKENIIRYDLVKPSGVSLSVASSAADVACRIDKSDGEALILYADNHWDYPEIAWGNYCRAMSPLPCHAGITLILRP